MTNFTIIVGTVMGTAQEVAEFAKTQLAAQNHSATIHMTFNPSILNTDDNDILLVCTSNTGMGDLPENIRPFHQHLTHDFPRIAGKPYAIINLGDSSYPNFAEAGYTIEHALNDIGASPIIEMLILDASKSDDNNADVSAWLKTLMQTI